MALCRSTRNPIRLRSSRRSGGAMKPYAQARRGSWPVTLSLAAAGILYLVFSFYPTSRVISQLRDEIRSTESFIDQSASLAISLVHTEAELRRTKDYVGGAHQ